MNKALPVVLGLGALVWFIATFRHESENELMQALFHQAAPTRYAYISAQTPQLAIVDLLQSRELGLIPLKIKPDVLAISTQNLLYYAQLGTPLLYRQKIPKATAQVEKLPFDIAHWRFNPSRQSLTLAGAHQLATVNAQGTITLSPRTPHPIRGLQIDPESAAVWVWDARTLMQWQQHQLENRATILGLRPESAVSAEGLFLALLAEDAGTTRLILWRTDANKIAWEAHENGTWLQPYIDGDTVWWLRTSGTGLRLNLRTLKSTAFRSVSGAHALYSGFLGTRLLVLGAHAALLNRNPWRLLQKLPAITAQEAFITADTTTALYLQNRALHSLAFKDGRQQSLPLSLKAPQKILMARGATLCH